MHVEICDVSCVLVKTVKTQKQIKYKKKINAISCTQVMRIKKNITRGLLVDAIPNSPN